MVRIFIGSNVLEVLNQEFAHLSAEHPMAVVNLIETKATPVSPLGIELKFVETDSAGIDCLFVGLIW